MPIDRSVARTVLGAWGTARTWRELAYLLVGAPLALAALVAVIVSLAVGAFLAITVVGVLILAATISGARHLGAVHRGLVAGLLHEQVEAPPPRRRRPGLLGGVGSRLADLAGWRAIAYTFASFPVKVIGAYWVVVGIGVSGSMLAYPVLWRLIDSTNTDSQGVEHRSLMQFGEFYIDTWPRAIGVSFLGLLALMAMAWVVRLVVLVDVFGVRLLLGPGSLSKRVSDLEETRAHAVDDSAATLRRIERDLHDGTQARLVALAMQLDLAREGLAPADGPSDGSDPADGTERTRALLETAHRNATEAIAELREVTRRIHPPALDKGLDAALATLAARSAVPVALRVVVPVRPSPAVETIAYFCAAELLTNVAKHSDARQAALDAFLTEDEARPGPTLRLRVTDDGRGGADQVPGGGLSGLAERVRTIDGAMSVSSPPGGPTVVTVDLPLRS